MMNITREDKEQILIEDKFLTMLVKLEVCKNPEKVVKSLVDKLAENNYYSSDTVEALETFLNKFINEE